MKQTVIRIYTGLKADRKNDKEEYNLDDFEATFNCRFHPTDFWHEVGCPHQAWGIDDLQKALNMAKQSQAYALYMAIKPKT